MAYNIIRVERPSYTYRLRVQGKPRMFIIHATRGHTTIDLQDDATLSWFTHGSIDQGGWGSTADVLISADDDNIYEFGDIMTYHSSWSAGYGALGSAREWGADEWAISIELAQTDRAEPFTNHVIDKLLWYIKKRNADWKLDIPYKHLTEWSQRRGLPIPNGLIGHDELANGIKTGKSDPGSQFPWDDVIRRLKDEPKKEVPVVTAPPTKQELLNARYEFADIMLTVWNNEPKWKVKLMMQRWVDKWSRFVD